MAELEPDHLVYVDRRNNVLKLSQGEFVAVSKLEAVYAVSPLIRQIYVYGSSERPYLLAVIRGVALPDAKFQAAAEAANLGSEDDIPHLTPALIEKYTSDQCPKGAGFAHLGTERRELFGR